MNYIEKHPKPQCCRDCPEGSVEICFHCEHFREKFVVLDSELAEEQLRRQVLRKLLKVERDEDYSVIRWKSVSHRPVNATYVLLKERDEEFGVVCWLAAYEKNKFWYFDYEKPKDSVNESNILGWDYLPYEDHLNEEAEKAFDSFMTQMGKVIGEEWRKQIEQNAKEKDPQEERP